MVGFLFKKLSIDGAFSYCTLLLSCGYIIPLSTVQEVVSNLTAIMKHWCCVTVFLRLTAQVCILLLREISRAAELCFIEVIHLVRLQNFRLTYVCVSGGKKCWFFAKFCGRTKWMIPYRGTKSASNRNYYWLQVIPLGLRRIGSSL